MDEIRGVVRKNVFGNTELGNRRVLEQGKKILGGRWI